MSINYLKDLKDILDSNIRILLTTPSRCGSTPLANVILGLLQHHSPLKYTHNLIDSLNSRELFKDNILIKTHDTNIKQYLELQKQYDVYIITIIRDPRVNVAHAQIKNNFPNVLEFTFDETNEKEINNPSLYVTNIIKKLKTILPYKITSKFRKNLAIKRIENMNNVYSILKYDIRPFETKYPESFFAFNGSHKHGHSSIKPIDIIQDLIIKHQPEHILQRKDVRIALINLVNEFLVNTEKENRSTVWKNLENIENVINLFKVFLNNTNIKDDV